jgi:uncharacterized delta-60 repeat protein
MKMLQTASALLLAGILVAGAQTNFPGYIDTSFTANCLTNPYNNTVKSLFIQDDGKIVAAGAFLTDFNHTCQNVIFRCDSNGVTDATFNSPFALFPSINAILPVGGGKIVVAGSLYIGSIQHAVARLNANGALDGTFSLTQTNPSASTPLTFSAVAIDSNNRVVLGGNLFEGGQFKSYIKRLNAAGTVDPTFTGGGVVSTTGFGGINAVAVQPDNKVIIGGLFASIGATARSGLARLNEDGSLDDTFRPPFGGFSQVAAIRLLTNGQMLVAGQFVSTNGGFFRTVARLNADGSFDPGFTLLNGSSVNGKAMAVQPDGKIIVTHNYGAWRLSANGVLDTNYFKNAGTITTPGLVSIALDSSGRAVVGAEYMSVGSTTRRGLIRLHGGNGPDPVPPQIVTQPTDQTGYAGGSATFSVTASGSTPLVHHWYFGGVNVGGSSTVTFGPPLDIAHDNTSIYCVVTNLYGRVTSSVVTLRVLPPPVAPDITSAPASVSVSNPAPITASMLTETALRGKMLRMLIRAGAAPFPASGSYDILLAESGNTYSIPAGGAMGASSGTWSFGPDLGIDTVLTLSSSFPGGGPVKVALLANGIYEMYADGVVNNQSGTYSIAYLDGTPVGPTVTFTVGASGTAPFAYAWMFEGSPIAPPPPAKALTAAAAGNVFGALTATLTISNATPANAGKYLVIVSNIAGAATSSVATLTVNGFSGGTPDRVPPKLVVKSPPATVRAVGSNSMNFAGTASDNAGLSVVAMSVNDGAFVPVSGLTAWSATAALSPGSNVIRIRAADLSGNAVTNTRVLVHAPAIAAAGVFNGLFYDTGLPAHARAGTVSFTIKPDGKFTGKVRMGLASYPLAGAFGTAFAATSTVPRTGLSPLQIVLHLAGHRIDGTVAEGANWTALLVAYPAKAVGALAGNYNLALPGNDDAATAPGGNGYLPLAISGVGRASGSGALGDGSPARAALTISADGHVPFYLPLYGGAGSMFGWLEFSTDAPTGISGELFWSKPSPAGGAFYPAGFTNIVLATGSRYVAPAAGTPALTLTNGVVILDGGNLAGPITNRFTLGADNKISGANQLAITIVPAKGTFSGSFVDPATSAKRTIKGVILRRQNFGAGMFLGSNQSGGVYIGEEP